MVMTKRKTNKTSKAVKYPELDDKLIEQNEEALKKLALKFNVPNLSTKETEKFLTELVNLSLDTWLMQALFCLEEHLGEFNTSYLANQVTVANMIERPEISEEMTGILEKYCQVYNYCFNAKDKKYLKYIDSDHKYSDLIAEVMVRATPGLPQEAKDNLVHIVVLKAVTKRIEFYTTILFLYAEQAGTAPKGTSSDQVFKETLKKHEKKVVGYRGK